MNIFVISDDPQECARYLDDRRLVKMVLETTQLLSSAIWLNGGRGPYKLTHQHHPCTKWAANSKINYLWLFQYWCELCNEYWRRYRREHKCCEVLADLVRGYAWLPSRQMSPRPRCVHDAYKHKSMPLHDAYKHTLRLKWEQDAEAGRPARCKIYRKPASRKLKKAMKEYKEVQWNLK